MKLSQLTTDEALDVLCEITPAVASIVGDEELMNVIGKAVKRDGMTRAGMMLLGAEKLSKIVPVVMKEHRSDVFAIVAAVNKVSAEEIASQNVIKTSMQIRELCKDKELIDFFRSCAEPVGNM